MGGLFLFTFGLASQEIIGFESRFYLFALEMWRHGPTFFPLTYQEPYPDYPASSTFLIYIFAKCCHGLNKCIAVFPSALTAAVTLATTYAIGALQSKRWGLASVLFLLFTLSFVMEARTISLDQYVTMITTLCFYCIYANQIKHHNTLWFVFPLMAIGFLFRGPMGLVIPAGVMCAIFLIERDFRRLFIYGLLSGLLLVACTLALIGIAYHVGHHEFIQEVLQKEVFGRMDDLKTPPFYFYFIQSFGAYFISYPLALLVLLGMLPRINHDLVKKSLGWIMIIMIGLSIPGDKKIRYILPIAPALSLICGYLFIASNEKKYFYYLRKLIVTLCFSFPTICFFVLTFAHLKHPEMKFYFYPAILFMLIMQCGAVLFKAQPIRLLMIAVITFIAGIVFVIEPINLDINRTREFVQTSEDLRKVEHAKLVFFNQEKDGWVIKYVLNMNSDEIPIFINSDKELINVKDSAFFVTLKENFEKLKDHQSWQIKLNGKMGRKNVIVFCKRKE